MTVGLFPICGDVLHAGHVVALKEAKDNCDILVVALNTHPDGKNPVESVYERYTKLAELKCVDTVIPYQGRADLELLAATFNYNVRFLGSDYIGKDWDGKEQEMSRGITAHFINRGLHGLSSTELKERIKAS